MRRRLVAAALATFAAAGCADSAQEPQTLPPLSPQTSAAPTSAPLPSPSLTGAKAAVERAMLAYFAAINTATVTGDLTAYSQLHGPTCQACRNLTELIRSTKEKGQRFEGATDVIQSYTIPDFSGPNAVVDVTFRVTPYRIVASDGSVVTESKGSLRRNLIVMNQVDGRWLVGEVNAT